MGKNTTVVTFGDPKDPFRVEVKRYAPRGKKPERFVALVDHGPHWSQWAEAAEGSTPDEAVANLKVALSGAAARRDTYNQELMRNCRTIDAQIRSMRVWLP